MDSQLPAGSTRCKGEIGEQSQLRCSASKKFFAHENSLKVFLPQSLNTVPCKFGPVPESTPTKCQACHYYPYPAIMHARAS